MADFPFDIEEDLLDKVQAGRAKTSITENEDGTAEVSFDVDEVETDPSIPADAVQHDVNLATFLDKEALQKVSSFCQQRYTEDKMSNTEFFDIIKKGLARLGMAIEELNEPFPGASPVTHPIMLESALKTQAKIMGEIFNGRGLVDTYIGARSDTEVMQRATRIKKYMDYQYLHKMSEFIPETEKLSFRFGLTGNAYRKYFFDEVLNRAKTKYITEDKFIINTNATTIADADFHTEVMIIDRHELEHRIENGEYADIFADSVGYGGTVSSSHDVASDIEQEITIQTGDPMGYQEGENLGPSKYTLLEHNCYLRLPAPFNNDETRAIPYIVTVEERSQRIVSIRRNWDEADPQKKKLVWYVHYKLIPGLGFHGLGYIHILGNFQFALTQIMRSIIDAGQFANLQGGFRAKGIRFTRDATLPLRFGEFREIDTHGKNIQDVLYPMQFKEPSQVLEALFGQLDGRVQKFADSAEQVISDSTNYGPVGTTVALLEASAKFVSGIIKRFYTSLTEEFKILYYLNHKTLDEESEFFVRGEENIVRQEDFKAGIEVVPNADPNLSSSAHRISLAQTKLTAAQQQPQLHDLRAAYTEFYNSLGMDQDEIDRLLPPSEDAQPNDPLTDIITVSSGKPIKAFEGQDHDAHIRFKTAFLNDPQAGKSEQAVSVAPLIQANIAEHILLKYVSRVKGAMQEVDPQQIGGEMAQAVAAELAARVNTLENNMDLLEANDPAMIFAMAEQKNADVREKEQAHKERTDAAKLILQDKDQLLKAMKLAKDSDLKQLAIEAGTNAKRLELGSKMLEKALADPKPESHKKQ